MKISPNPKPFRYSLGERGENIAAALVRQNGFKILQKNYKCKIGEIDLIAEKAERIHFIEVKTRSGSEFGSPAEAVDRKKQEKLFKLAAWYLKEKKLKEPLLSFDIIAVTWKKREAPEARWIMNAFEKGEEPC